MDFELELLSSVWKKGANGWLYLLAGGRGFGLGAGKTRSVENARKRRRIPPVRCKRC